MFYQYNKHREKKEAQARRQLNYLQRLKILKEMLSTEWVTPEFVKIKNKKTKRISPYLDNELWEKDDLLKYLYIMSYIFSLL